VVQHHLLRTQQRMKHQSDKNRSERVFNVGDMVYLKLQPYVQTSVATRANHKLSYKYFGSFQILQKVGVVAYKLQLPASANIHLVFHVSRLKSSLRPKCLVSSTIPAITNQYPLQAVKRRTISRGGRPVNQVLVHWSNSNDVLDSWEDEDALRQQFPRAAAWGQAVSQERGYVRRLKMPERRDAEDELTERREADTVPEAETKMGRSRRVRRPSGRFPSDVWTK
jgi:ribosomal protein L21E